MSDYQSKPWLSSYENGVPEKIEYDETCITEFLGKTAKEFPDIMALLFQGYKMTFRELDEMVDNFAAVLYDFGIKKGDSVAILLPNLITCL